MILDKLYKVGIVVLAAGSLAGVIGYFMKESPREMPPVLYELSSEVAEEFAKELPRERDVNELLLLVLQRGNRDEEAQFKELLKRKVRDSGKYKVKNWDDVKKDFDNNVWAVFAQKMGLVPGQDPKDLAQAKSAIKILAKTGMSIDGVLLANVEDFDEGQEGLGAKVTVKGELVSVAQDKTLKEMPPITRSVDSTWNYTYLHHKLAKSSFLLRFLGWFLVAATLPFALIAVVRAIVQRRQNELNLAMLATFTVVDVALAWILLSAISLGMGTAFFLLIVAALMGYYNYDACDYIERRLT